MTTCTKVKYSTEKFAWDDIARIKKSSTRSKVPTGVYFCSKCSNWHLTSQYDKKNERINELMKDNRKLKDTINKMEQASESAIQFMNKAITILNKDNG